MGLRFEEYPSNSAEQVREDSESALALVDELQPDDDLRQAVFVKACDLYSNKQRVPVQDATIVPGLVAPHGL